MAGSYDNHSMQKKLEAPMPLIGMYIALASLACSLTMAADLVHGFRTRKLWFPSKYFSLNAASLTLLAIALKLPADISTNIWAATDRLAKISSLALTSTAVAHFMPSLGSMSDKGILVNTTALTIIIITVLADVSIQVVGMRSFLHHRVFFPEEILVSSLMVILLLLLGSTAMMVLTTKKCLEAKYQEKQNLGWNHGGVGVDKLRNLVDKYWMMAETSSPQFVIARSAASAASGAVCLVNGVVLAQAIARIWFKYRSFRITSSSYGCSTILILVLQTIGVIFGLISASFRWCIAVRFTCSGRSLRDVFKVEDYWTRKLVECKGSLISSRIKNQKCRRFLYKSRGFALDFILRIQICFVLFSKLVLVISNFLSFSVTQFIKHLAGRDPPPSFHRRREVLQSLRRNSLRLEGEADLPDYILHNISKQSARVLRAARRQKSTGLTEFLRNSTFKGVAEFDRREVPSIHGKEPKICWSLATVTLTTIAIALPNVPKSKVDRLISDVSDGLVFVKIVERSFYKNEEWNNVRKAADYWIRVDLFRKWQEINLAGISSITDQPKQALEILSEKSKIIASDLKTDIPDCPMFNPSNWPPKIIAANSMYRISTTILNTNNFDEELFDRLCATIADILAACFTNLARVIAQKCQIKSIEDRERSVLDAARLLGKSEEMLDFLVKRDLPVGLNPNYGAAFIEEWRGAMFQEDEISSEATTPFSNTTATSDCSSPGITLLDLMQADFEFSR